jgi:hypothetical protein
MSSDDEVTTHRITVSFHVDIDLVELGKAKAELEKFRPTTAEHTYAFDRLKAMKTYMMGRLEGECQAYMNIAKDEVREFYGV